MAGSTHSTLKWPWELHSAHLTASSDCFIAVTWSIRMRNSSLGCRGEDGGAGRVDNIIASSLLGQKFIRVLTFFNPQNWYKKQKRAEFDLGQQVKKGIWSYRCAPTWEFGLLAGVAGGSRVTGAHQLIRNNRTFPLPTLWNEGTEPSLGPNRKKMTAWQLHNKQYLI